jgi:hypothetical protein
MPPSLGDLTELEVDGLNRVRGIRDPPQLRRVIQERDELVPRPALHVDRTGVLLAEAGFEGGEGEFGRFQGGGGVDRSHAGGDLLAVGVGDTCHGVADDVDITPISA